MLPLMQSVKRLFTGTRTSKWLMGSAAAVAFAVPTVAQAGRNDRDVRDVRVEHREVEHRVAEHHEIDRHDFDRGDGHDRGIGLDVRIGDRRPVIEERTTQVWVPEVYETRTEQVLVPDQFEDRQVRYLDHGRWCTRTERVLVTPAHYETRQSQVCVSEGHYETRVDPVAVVNPRLGGFDLHIGR